MQLREVLDKVESLHVELLSLRHRVDVVTEDLDKYGKLLFEMAVRGQPAGTARVEFNCNGKQYEVNSEYKVRRLDTDVMVLDPDAEL